MSAARKHEPKPPPALTAAERFAYKIDEAAHALGVSRTTLYKLVRDGELEIGTLAGRSVIRREVLEAFMKRAYTPTKLGPGTGQHRAA